MTDSIEFETHINRLEYLLGIHYLFIPKNIIEKMGGKMKTRVICTVNNQLSFQGGFMALGNGDAYVSINNQRLKKLALRSGDKVKLKLELDKSKYGAEIPAELEELLLQDEIGNKKFEALSDGKKRYIIHHVAGVKNSNLRLERAIVAIENLKLCPSGKENWRKILGYE
jgi:hypothetical protein